MGAEDGIEDYVARAQFMRESLGKSQTITDTMISILGSFDNRLSTLESAMRPTQVSVFFNFMFISLTHCPFPNSQNVQFFASFVTFNHALS